MSEEEGMSEASGEKREKEETFSEHQETGWSKAKRWLEGGKQGVK